ncbi:uncharacterized protein FIBRA_01462 [Fibroporia radiculosa]|uniref:RRM domain-containing protein n=1 Tax=Fibroporia radiculosa TaxID=599839 RepID=J4H149_9APHY|nr:uncharacterized protein FIBRA_01462 [Fibroporia radiculosa]CCL99444.1 predicted protein [Fibroporia radiculosa]
MSSRGRSISPRPLHDADIDMDRENGEKLHARVVVVTNLTRNVVESHLRTIFSFYGEITKIDLPVFGKSGQNRGKAALEYANTASAHNAQSHMDGGQLDGAILKVELSDLPVRTNPAPSLGPHRARALPLDDSDAVDASTTAFAEGHTRVGVPLREIETPIDLIPGLVRAPLFEEEIVYLREEDHQAMSVVERDSDGVRAPGAILCAQAVLARVPSPPDRARVRSLTRHIHATRVAGVVRARLVVQGGAIVGTTLEIAGRGPRETNPCHVVLFLCHTPHRPREKQ